MGTSRFQLSFVCVNLSISALLFSGCGMAYLVDEPIVRNNTFQGFNGRLVDAESGDGVANAKIIVKPATDNDPKPFYIYSTGDGSFQLSNYKKQGVSHPFEEDEEYNLVINSVSHRIKDFKVVFEGGAQRLGAIELSRIEEGGRVQMVIPGRTEATLNLETQTRLRMGPPIP